MLEKKHRVCLAIKIQALVGADGVVRISEASATWQKPGRKVFPHNSSLFNIFTVGNFQQGRSGTQA
jgi:hypothetical protein